MDAWVKDVLQPLLIAITATAIGSGSLFVLCAFLWKFMMKWWHSQARGSALPAWTPDTDSDDQPLPQAAALHDVEMGPMNGGGVGESADLPCSANTDNANAAEMLMEMSLNIGEARMPRASDPATKGMRLPPHYTSMCANVA